MSNDWTEIKISVSADDVERVGYIANMVVPYGIYIEDYRFLEQEALEIAHIDLIDEELLQKDRSKGAVHIYISPEANPAEAVSYLTDRLDSEKIEYSIDESVCRSVDWENNWKKYFKPLTIGEKLLIRPTWEDEYDAGNRAVLHLEPGLAFGSGTHDTTRLCLETLEKYASAGKTVLDIGCGSGILSVAALLLGAQSAVGVDIDPHAVKTAVDNGRENGFTEPRLQYFQGNLTEKVSGRFDIVVANIVADIVALLCRDVKNYLNPDGVFITSGIIEMREQQVLDAFAENGLKVTGRYESGGWLCFTATE